GSFWAIANPLLMLSIFTYIFGYVYKIRLPGAETTLAYATWLISGYGPWLAASEAIMAAAMSVVSGAAILKNMAFKTEILPIAAALTGVVPLTVSFSFLIVLLVLDGNTPTLHAVLLPIVICFQFFFIISLGFFLSAVTVFIRDFGIALPNLLLVLLFLTPIFYPFDSMPTTMQTLSLLNPFYILAEAYRRPLIYHQMPPLWGLAYVAVLSTVLSYFGLKLFRRVKGHFAAML
ncbi:MAG TPA: ABC transporter permease, partial [Pyrinomonadaceae bacterium]|nr:ABC transporter permease [Pyrinomonadaceae bacterium]